MVQRFSTHLCFFLMTQAVLILIAQPKNIVIKTHKSSWKLNYVKHTKQNKIKILLAHIWAPYIYEHALLVAEDALPNNTDE